MTHTGSCLCGAVSFEIDNVPDAAGACHCSMCRKWSGGVLLGIEIKNGDLAFNGTTAPATYPSSDWAERGFCPTCGSNLFYRITAPGPHQGDYVFALGALDNPNGITLTREIFIDEKPGGYAFPGETERVTGADMLALVARPD